LEVRAADIAIKVFQECSIKIVTDLHAKQ